VVASDGWWTRGKRINFNLDISVDGLVNAAFQMQTKMKDFFKTDGIIDFDIHIRDSDGDSLPEYDWRTVYPSINDLRVSERSFLMVNAKDNEAPLAPIFPWPYLGHETYGYLTSSPHQSSQPPIQLNWDTGTITTVGEFVSSRGNDSQWFIYSYNEVKPGQTNETNFENPFAWYDLAQDADGAPELAVRFIYYPPRDPIFNNGTFSKAMNIIRYSWDQDNDGHWDYKLSLVGKHQISSTVSLPEFGLRMLPYREIPAWVANQSWEAVTFVSAELREITGEGIYVWDHPAWFTDQYITGMQDSPNPPPDAEWNLIDFGYGEIPEGFRGEFHNTLQSRSLLYLSAVDHKLHLLKAESGIWNISDREEIRYSNVGGGDFIDQWVYKETARFGEEPNIRTLNVSDNHLLYSGEEMVILREAKVSPDIFIILPPADHQQWKSLGDKLVEYTPTFTPGDFRAMMGQFAGQETRVIGASQRNYRTNAEGDFQFVLSLKFGYQVEGSDILNLSKLQPGEYLVAYNGRFEVKPLVPPIIKSSIIEEPIHELQLNPVSIQLTNNGLEDLPEATLELWATSPDGITNVVATQTVQLLAGEPITPTLLWSPSSSGTWILTPKILQPSGDLISGNPVSVMVTPSMNKDPLNILLISTSPERLPVILLGLISLAALGSLAFWNAGRKSFMKKGDADD